MHLQYSENLLDSLQVFQHLHTSVWQCIRTTTVHDQADGIELNLAQVVMRLMLRLQPLLRMHEMLLLSR